MKITKHKYWEVVSWAQGASKQSIIASKLKEAMMKAEKLNKGFTCKEIREIDNVYSVIKLQKCNELYSVYIDSDTLLSEGRTIYIIATNLNEAMNLAWRIYLQGCNLTIKEKKTLFISSAKYLDVIYF